MIVNFRTREINRDTDKLTRTPILILKTIKIYLVLYIYIYKIF